MADRLDITGLGGNGGRGEKNRSRRQRLIGRCGRLGALFMNEIAMQYIVMTAISHRVTP